MLAEHLASNGGALGWLIIKLLLHHERSLEALVLLLQLADRAPETFVLSAILTPLALLLQHGIEAFPQNAVVVLDAIQVSLRGG